MLIQNMKNRFFIYFISQFLLFLQAKHFHINCSITFNIEVEYHIYMEFNNLKKNLKKE